MFIGDSIGEDYKKWGPGSTIFISSQTGSGKTTFILKQLLPYAKEQNKKILYLVNRKILKEQMEKEILTLPLELAEYITVELYQTIENQSLNLSKRPYEPELQIGFKRALIQAGLPTANQEYLLKQNKQYFGNRYFVDGFKFLKKYDNYDYVVCDEAHYFLMDSNYNTNTFMSYKFIKMYFSHKTRIFMSATIDEIKCFIERDEEKGNKYRTFWYDYKYAQDLSYNLKNNLFAQQRKFHYVQELDYDYINVKVIYHLKELATLIVKGTAKWLVFVDSKDFGNRLKRKISEISSEYETIVSVAFVTADYELDDESKYEVDQITEQNKQSVKVLIATSVLDNGINLKDMELRNVVILADTKTEFVQMLGRKRQDGEKLNAYIYKQDRDHFVKRKRMNDRRKKIAEKNYFSFIEEVGPKAQMIQDQEIIAMIEEDFIISNHKILLQKIMNGKMRFDDVKALFFNYDGILTLSMLSVQNVDNLGRFYDYMIEQFENVGEDAFLYEQLRWLKKTDEEIKTILQTEKESYYERCRRILIKELGKNTDEEIPSDQFKEFKKKLMPELKALVEHVDVSHESYAKYKRSAGRTDRPISEDFMDFLRENCDIPFKVTSTSGFYYVEKVEVTESTSD